MSYSVQKTYWNCKKEKDCTDHVNIQNAVNDIHKNCLNQGGHLGSGVVDVLCSRLDAKDK